MPKFMQQPINGHRSGLTHRKKISVRKVVSRFSFVFALILLAIFIGVTIWYNLQLAPVGGNIGQLKQVVIKPGDNSFQIGQELEKKFIVRNAVVFDIYTKLSGKNNTLQAGTYRLSPAESVQQITEHFVKGNVDQFSLTFYPGAALSDNSNIEESKKLDARTVLRRAGYSDTEISEGFNRVYSNPLFAGKPAGTGIEGYIYGETYMLNSGASVSDILERVFDEFYEKVNENGLIDGFSARGLNLYQGITLASIVQSEVSNENDQRQVAQVFYSRLSQGIVLGSDVTYQYIADKTGVARNPNLDSLYNTRRYSGLPPGPISSPGLSALLAVKTPAQGSYVYFLSGDDGKTYFAYTEDEHQSNRVNYCQVKCAKP